MLPGWTVPWLQWQECDILFRILMQSRKRNNPERLSPSDKHLSIKLSIEDSTTASWLKNQVIMLGTFHKQFITHGIHCIHNYRAYQIRLRLWPSLFKCSYLIGKKTTTNHTSGNLELKWFIKVRIKGNVEFDFMWMAHMWKSMIFSTCSKWKGAL